MSGRVALYVRVSTEERAEHGYSIAAQIEILTDHAKAQNWCIVETFVDEGKSAKTMGRPALQAMLRQVRDGKIDTVLVWKTSRLTSTLADLTALLDLLLKHDVALVSYSERFDLSTAMGKAMLHVSGVFAELERNNLSENVHLGQRSKARQGGWNGGTVYGYDNSANGLKPNPNEAPVVRRIFEWYTSGHGAITICNLLNDQKIPTKRGGTWYVQGVMTILDNPIYKKSIRYGVTNNYAAGKPTQHRGHYLLSGLLRCPACEAKMVGWHLSRKDRLYRYYKCGDFNSKGKSICKGNYVQADAAERDVLARLSQVLPNSVLVSEALERATRESGTKTEPLRNEMAALSDQILRIEQKIGKLVEAVENDTLPGAIVQGRMAEHQQALAAVISRRSDLESELNLCTDTVVPTAQIHEALSRFHGVLEAAEPDLQKQLLAALIDRITVTKERVLDQVLLAFDPLSLLCKLDTDSSTASNVTFTYGTVHRITLEGNKIRFTL